jgi:hypothetical protein
VALSGHVHQDLPLSRVGDAVHLEHRGQVHRLGRGLARLDAGQRGRGHAEALGHFFQLDRMIFTETAKFRPKPPATDGGTHRHGRLTSSGHPGDLHPDSASETQLSVSDRMIAHGDETTSNRS